MAGAVLNNTVMTSASVTGLFVPAAAMVQMV